MTCPVFAPSVDASLSMTLLPAVISLTSGSVDVISFLGLGGLFTDKGSSETYGHLTMAHPALWAEHVREFVHEMEISP
jgi:hypothetical protein